jgi:hypothetical protein
MQHLTTLVTEEAAQGVQKVLKLLHEVESELRVVDTQGSIGNVYELYVDDADDVSWLMHSVEAYVMGRAAGFELLQKNYGNDWDAMHANIQADVDHHEASPWH